MEVQTGKRWEHDPRKQSSWWPGLEKSWGGLGRAVPATHLVADCLASAILAALLVLGDFSCLLSIGPKHYPGVVPCISKCLVAILRPRAWQASPLQRPHQNVQLCLWEGKEMKEGP